MKRTLTVLFLIVALLTVSLVPSCEKDGDPTGPALFLATVLILGITVGGWFDDNDDKDDFPPAKYDIMSRHGEGKFVGSILSPNDRDWFRTEMMREGERLTVWSESQIGVRAVLFDEYGDYYSSTNYSPGTNFRFEIKAKEWMSYYLMVTGHDSDRTGPYTLYWKYSR